MGPVARGVQRIWKSCGEPPGYRSKDDHLRFVLMCIDGPQLVTAPTNVGADWGLGLLYLVWSVYHVKLPHMQHDVCLNSSIYHGNISKCL